MSKNRTTWTTEDLFIPGLAALLAVYYLYTVRGLPFLAQMYGGTLSILCLLCFGIVLYLYCSGRSSSGKTEPGNLSTFVAKYCRFIGLFVLTALFIGILPYAGYFLSVMFLGVSVAVWLGYSRKVSSLLKVGVGIALAGFVLFVLFLNVDLPLDGVSLFIKEAIQSCWK